MDTECLDLTTAGTDLGVVSQMLRYQQLTRELGRSAEEVQSQHQFRLLQILLTNYY